MNVLLIEDNETLADTIKEYLKIKHIECKENFLIFHLESILCNFFQFIVIVGSNF